MPPPTAVIVSYRLGGTDGVSIEADKWSWALGQLGFVVSTVAGAGPPGRVDRVLPQLALDATEPPESDQVQEALGHADLVVAENICSLPLNPAAGAAVAHACRGRPAILHHHDLAWQRPYLAHHPGPPQDDRWRHVTINDLSRRQLAKRGIRATTIPNTFDTHQALGHRQEARRALGLNVATPLVLQPTRALYRKNVPGGLWLAERLGATYWLLGPPEDGFGPHLERIMAHARCPVLRGDLGTTGSATGDLQGGARRIDLAYAACDVVVLPSLWEGFGNPTIESAVHRRPLAIGPFPVGAELRAKGFEWFALFEHRSLARWLEQPDPSLTQHNLEVARRHFSLEDLPKAIAAVLEDLRG